MVASPTEFDDRMGDLVAAALPADPIVHSGRRGADGGELLGVAQANATAAVDTTWAVTLAARARPYRTRPV